MAQSNPAWICCQLGAREHYAIPRTLHQAGQLSHLITDAWVPPQSVLHSIPTPLSKNLLERFHPDLAQASVTAFTPDLIRFELQQRFKRTDTWSRIIARNNWFQQHALQQLQAIENQYARSNIQPILFTYSYAALELLNYAKRKGWFTILGQIDPGLVEEQIVAQENANHPTLAPTWQPAPHPYWQTWKEECSIADRIIVNSSWSAQALQQVGVPASKMSIIPLAYSPPAAATQFEREYPTKFSPECPLRVLFLGQVILRKGLAALLDAAQRLQDQPIEFWLVGAQGITKNKEIESLKKTKWIGTVPRSAVVQYYQNADVFLFPTLSDGFGLTQLEAQAWKLPIISSRFCGEVVKDGINGFTLPEVTGAAIEQALRLCLNNPQQLETFSRQSIALEDFSLSQLHHQLQSLLHAIV